MNLKEIERLFPELYRIEKNGLDFDVFELISWIESTEKEYKETLEKIYSIHVDTPFYSIRVSCDVSSFDYFKRNNESNYMQITVSFKGLEYSGTIEELRRDLEHVREACEGLVKLEILYPPDYKGYY